MEGEIKSCFLPPVNKALTFNIYVRGEAERLSKFYFGWIYNWELNSSSLFLTAAACGAGGEQSVLHRLGLFTAHLLLPLGSLPWIQHRGKEPFVQMSASSASSLFSVAPNSV